MAYFNTTSAKDCSEQSIDLSGGNKIKNCFRKMRWKGTNLTSDPKFVQLKLSKCRSQWSRGLRRRYAAARLLRPWVRIPPGAWMFVCCECCVLSGRGLGEGWSLIQRSPTEYGVSLRDVGTSKRWGDHGLRWVAAPQEKNMGFTKWIFLEDCAKPKRSFLLLQTVQEVFVIAWLCDTERMTSVRSSDRWHRQAVKYFPELKSTL